MRPFSASLALAVLLASSAAAAPSRRQSIQCAPADKDGTPLTGSAPVGDMVTCSYQGAGDCTYFPANGSFSSGSSQCPAGVAQDPSVTTDAPSSVGGGAATSTAPSSTADAGASSIPGASSTSASTPAVSIPASSTSARGTATSSRTVASQTQASSSPSPSKPNAAAHVLSSGTSGMLVTLLGLALGVIV